MNPTHSAETEAADEKLSDGNEDMEVDNVNRVGPSKDKVTKNIGNKKETIQKLTMLELLAVKSKQQKKTKKFFKESFLIDQLKSNHKMKARKRAY